MISKGTLNYLNNKKIWLAIISLCLVIFIIISGYLIIKPDDEIQIPPLTLNSLDKDYSRLDEVKPGINSIAEVKEINGEPLTELKKGNKTYLIYKTPSEAFENVVVVEGNKVVYSKENVFGDYRGNVADFESEKGKPDFTLFEDGYRWSVYLKDGIAINHDSRNIGAILYFVPQTKEEFIKTLAKELNMTEVPTAIEESFEEIPVTEEIEELKLTETPVSEE